MKTPRIRVRELMIAVALAALVCYGWVLRDRSAKFATEANRHYGRMGLCLTNRDRIAYDPHMTPMIRRTDLPDYVKRDLENLENWAWYEEQLIRKYRWAAIFPWFSPGDNPPPPTPRPYFPPGD
jgi:hypothetical protein